MGAPKGGNTKSYRLGHTGMRQAIPATRKPSMRDLGWAAGFLEGEGSFDKGSRSIAGGQRVRAVQVSREPLVLLQEVFGGTISERKAKQPNANNFWEWN